MQPVDIVGIATRLFPHLPWLAFFALAGFFAIFTAVAVYHWFRYGLGNPMVWVGIGIYGAGAFVLLSTMLYALSQL